jgi:hippurate hydrolase
MNSPFFQQLAEWRRHLHANPELSHHEHQTAAFIAEKLTELGIAFETGIGGTGVVATIARPGSNHSVGLRADMDALPIAEQNDVPHVSRNPGVMHACGHDGHVTALLGTAASLAKDQTWQGTIRFVFQPAEEDGAGAKAMIADGLFERFPMDRVFAFHNWPGIAAGTVAVHTGPVMAAGGRWTITLRGQAGHAAKPHTTRDPIVAMGHLIVALQTVVSRVTDPIDSIVLSAGAVHGGTVSNQIPESVTLQGTLRSYRQEARETAIAAMHRITYGIAASFDMKAEIEVLSTGRPVINPAAEAAMAVDGARRAGLAVAQDCPPSTTGDDFAFLQLQRPSAYVWIGNGPVAHGAELHNGRYEFNDAILPAAVNWMHQTALLALAPDA